MVQFFTSHSPMALPVARATQPPRLYPEGGRRETPYAEEEAWHSLTFPWGTTTALALRTSLAISARTRSGGLGPRWEEGNGGRVLALCLLM